MPYLNAATDLYKGGTAVVAAYLGATKVWPPTTNSLSASLRIASNTGGKVSVEITTQYVGAPPASYKFYSNTGSGWTLRWTGGIGPHYFDTTYNTNFTMKVESFTSEGVMLSTVTTATINTGNRPTVQKSWSSTPVETASYNGSNGLRTRDPLYYGYFSGTHGTQKSQARWNIPSEIRNCVSVDRVELRWWNQHHFLSSGGTVSMVAHHNTGLSTYGGNTGALLNAGNQVRWPAPVGGWINGTEWYDLGWLTSVGRDISIAEEIRVHGLQGFGLVEAVGGQSGYGYASSDPQLRITYTVYT